MRGFGRGAAHGSLVVRDNSGWLVVQQEGHTYFDASLVLRNMQRLDCDHSIICFDLANIAARPTILLSLGGGGDVGDWGRLEQMALTKLLRLSPQMAHEALDPLLLVDPAPGGAAFEDLREVKQNRRHGIQFRTASASWHQVTLRVFFPPQASPLVNLATLLDRLRGLTGSQNLTGRLSLILKRAANEGGDLFQLEMLVTFSQQAESHFHSRAKAIERELTLCGFGVINSEFPSQHWELYRRSLPGQPEDPDILPGNRLFYSAAELSITSISSGHEVDPANEVSSRTAVLLVSQTDPDETVLLRELSQWIPRWLQKDATPQLAAEVGQDARVSFHFDDDNKSTSYSIDWHSPSESGRINQHLTVFHHQVDAPRVQASRDVKIVLWLVPWFLLVDSYVRWSKYTQGRTQGRARAFLRNVIRWARLAYFLPLVLVFELAAGFFALCLGLRLPGAKWLFGLVLKRLKVFSTILSCVAGDMSLWIEVSRISERMQSLALTHDHLVVVAERGAAVYCENVEHLEPDNISLVTFGSPTFAIGIVPGRLSRLRQRSGMFSLVYGSLLALTALSLSGYLFATAHEKTLIEGTLQCLFAVGVVAVILLVVSLLLEATFRPLANTRPRSEFLMAERQTDIVSVKDLIARPLTVAAKLDPSGPAGATVIVHNGGGILHDPRRYEANADEFLCVLVDAIGRSGLPTLAVPLWLQTAVRRRRIGRLRLKRLVRFAAFGAAICAGWQATEETSVLVRSVPTSMNWLHDILPELDARLAGPWMAGRDSFVGSSLFQGILVGAIVFFFAETVVGRLIRQVASDDLRKIYRRESFANEILAFGAVLLILVFLLLFSLLSVTGVLKPYIQWWSTLLQSQEFWPSLLAGVQVFAVCVIALAILTYVPIRRPGRLFWKMLYWRLDSASSSKSSRTGSSQSRA